MQHDLTHLWVFDLELQSCVLHLEYLQKEVRASEKDLGVISFIGNTRQSLMGKQGTIKREGLLELGMEGNDRGWKVGRYKHTKGLEKSYTQVTTIEAS